MTPSSKTIYQSQLPDSIRSKFIDQVNGLNMHYLECGEGPVILLLHGFPELAFSWRKIMPLLAEAGYRVIAPDQRGYGLTTGWTADDAHLRDFRQMNLVHDVVALFRRLAITKVHAVVGHDFGSPVAGFTALMRPDMVHHLVCMSAPFPGVPALDFQGPAPHQMLDDALASLERPRKHYQWYYSGGTAAQDLAEAPQGLSTFLRGYYHLKSGDAQGPAPAPLTSPSPDEFAKLPEYYVMDREQTMPMVVEQALRDIDIDRLNNCAWLSSLELEVYVSAFSETGFQGALNWYRCVTDVRLLKDLGVFSGAQLSLPTAFFAGKKDWGVVQSPGALQQMESIASERFDGIKLISGAGHWVQQEQPTATVESILQHIDASP